ncbi:TlpA family protein disulfide reductase [Kushneria marisflavi]|uniref:Uncharacterized protein n=1 Tax=Kushneria marisflavi TaxID=157779 RepID=A0A240UQ71_9GAMM|nr:hypothetical protein [Kushneria marisflavi]ART63641.1 hypothetical protein B9H00_11720 [Kushneria marisflavi]RKD85308.1 hypothetical protein C8D96_1196 [Kushneria marisflavi]
MDLPERILLSPIPLAVACATATLLTAHLISPSTRATTTRWALGALVFWAVGAALLPWFGGPGAFRVPWPARLGYLELAPAGGLIALLAWTLWYCRQRSGLRRRLCLVIMVSSGLWWGLEQWRTTLAPPLPDTLPTLSLESLEGRSVTPANETSNRYLLLWRSDCSTCRQWLQRLAEQPIGQQGELILVNQGESLLSAIRYLDQHPDQRLELEDTALLMDPRQHLLALTGQRHLPVLLHVAPDNTLTRISNLSTIMGDRSQRQ